MTPLFIEDFANRRRQVRHYALSVAAAERAAPVLASRSKEGRLLTLRAGTFLVLYNLVEASARAAVEAIHDRITTEQVPFELLSETIRIEVIRRFKAKADPDVHHALVDLPSAFVAVALDQSIELSGNVDARSVRVLGESYGFSCATNKLRTRDGADLLTIKTNRNDLAHGRKTFEEVGRNYPAGDLLPLARRSIGFMEEILGNVAAYLEAREYIRPDAR
ncbi:MAE_28990/MAE_18760 family HEPN-like nuclease [Methylorubrum populi]|uniref:MAE_28990/MAE_18760 family HEPN-like nuclease n=1 Tax=Methylorubrum populi TaxID=223967 RepID=UPI003F657977